MKTVHQQVEHTARAFYEASDSPLTWDDAPESVRTEFRQYARRAIALLLEYGGRNATERTVLQPRAEFRDAAGPNHRAFEDPKRRIHRSN